MSLDVRHPDSTHKLTNSCHMRVHYNSPNLYNDKDSRTLPMEKYSAITINFSEI
ncbi:MAG: hypothetical protein JETT_2301 [Candidatus Jettenia ecosi]|uniref:Uncharacterized protein n=1 Tax=Candidatus Jettenia ecosi TaxID=2494326 RepID=A0A533Q9T0_9BACT|nr:MAG: hypothetical protein JETT_2301 [Candidatus Jettenia ecosi]